MVLLLQGELAICNASAICNGSGIQVDVSASETLLFPECIELIATAANDGLIGRLAMSTDRAPIVEPVTFDYEDRAIIVHPGTGLLAESAPGSLVAFEVDDVDKLTFEAWSVLVRGLAISRELTSSSEDAYRPRTPLDLLNAREPKAVKTVLVVRLDVVTGRRFVLDRPRAPEHAQR
jgi:hypothetical protein